MPKQKKAKQALENLEAMNKRDSGVEVFYFASAILQIGGSKQALWCQKEKKNIS